MAFFLERQKLLELKQEFMEKSKIPTTSEEMELVI